MHGENGANKSIGNSHKQLLPQVELLPAGTSKLFPKYCLLAVSAIHPQKFTWGCPGKLSMHLSETLL